MTPAGVAAWPGVKLAPSSSARFNGLALIAPKNKARALSILEFLGVTISFRGDCQENSNPVDLERKNLGPTKLARG